MAGEPKEGGQSGPLLSRRDILKLGGGTAAAIVGGTWAATRNSDRKGTGRDPGAAPAGNNESTPDQTDQETDTQQDDQTTDDEQTIDITTPVDAPFYDSSVRNANIQDFHSDTEELRDAAQQGGHQGAVQIGRLFQGQTDAESAYAAAQILHTDPDLATDYVIDTIPGQINASDREYIFIQPVQNGQLLKPVIAGQAYDGFEVYNPENPEEASNSMRNKLMRDDFSGLSFAHDLEALKSSYFVMENEPGGSQEEIEEGKRRAREDVSQDFTASMLGVPSDDTYLLRPVSEEDWTVWDEARFGDMPYDVAGELQEAYKESDHYDNGQWTGFEIEMNGGEARYKFTDNIGPSDEF